MTSTLRHRTPPFALAIAGCVAFPGFGAADEVAWSNPSGGLFGEGANWMGNAPPNSMQTALFDLPASLTVLFGNNTQIDGLTARRGSTTLNLMGSLLDVGTPSAARVIRVGESAGELATLTVQGGSVHMHPFLSQVLIGNEAGSEGRLELTGSSTTFPMGGVTRVGGAGGVGALVVSDGATMSDTLPGAGFAGSLGMWPGSSILITGANSRLNMRTISSSGGQVTVSSGGRANGESWVMSGNTQISVTGAGSRLTCENGLSTNGPINVSDGATLYSIGPGSINTPELAVFGVGSTFGHTNQLMNGVAAVSGGAIASAKFTGTVTAVGPGTRVNLTSLNGSAIVSGEASAASSDLAGCEVIVTGLGSVLTGSTLGIGLGGAHTPVSIQEQASLQSTGTVIVGAGAELDVLDDGSFVTADLLTLAAEPGGLGVMTVGVGAEVAAARVEVGSFGSGPSIRSHVIVHGSVMVTDQFQVFAQGRVSGSGHVIGDVSNAGLLSTGTSAGRFSISGTFAQSSTGVLSIEVLGGNDGACGSVAVTGAASLGGMLNIMTAPGLRPVPGSIFDIILASSVTGTFASVVYPDLPGGVELEVQYHQGGVRVRACATADFDNDGDVGNDTDIVAFFACLGGNCCGECGTQDFDGDGDSGTDLDIEAFFAALGGAAC